MQLTDLKGIGKTRLEALHAAGICSLRDLLYTFPVRYRDLSSPTTVRQAQPGESVCLLLSRRGEAKLSRHGKLSRVTCTFADETGQISACWFNQPWMREHLNAGTRFMLYGRMEACGAGKRMTNPSLEKELGVVPVYRAIPDVPQRLHQAAVRQALEAAEQACPETLPERLLERFGLWPCARALRAAHEPASLQEAAKRYARGGYDVIVDGIVGPWFLEPWRALVREDYEVHYIVLRASKEETMKRAVERSKLDRKTNVELVETMWEQFCNLGIYESNVIETTTYSIQEAVFAVKEKISSGAALLS